MGHNYIRRDISRTMLKKGNVKSPDIYMIGL